MPLNRLEEPGDMGMRILREGLMLAEQQDDLPDDKVRVAESFDAAGDIVRIDRLDPNEWPVVGRASCKGCGLGLFAEEVERGDCNWCAAKATLRANELMELSAVEPPEQTRDMFVHLATRRLYRKDRLGLGPYVFGGHPAFQKPDLAPTGIVLTDA